MTDAAVDFARLEQQTYLTARQAAAYMGYTTDRCKDPVAAFLAVAKRAGIPKLHWGRSVRFFRRDLDEAVQAARRSRRKEA